MICGVDEAGRGPVMGPLVVAGVKVKDDSDLVRLGVKDSKKLLPRKREALAAEIMKIAECCVEVVPAEDLDQLMELMTINHAEAKVFASIIEKLKPETAYVDSGDSNESSFRSMIEKELSSKPEIICRHKADDMYPVVSAASILAKVRRDEEVRLIKEEIGEEIGSGYPSDRVTIAFLESWINRHGELPPHTRKAWKTSKRLLSMSKIRKLDE
jgi:ribonuclease HII